MSDIKMPTLSLILPVSELEIDVVPSPMDVMNYSVCSLLFSQLYF